MMYHFIHLRTSAVNQNDHFKQQIHALQHTLERTQQHKTALIWTLVWTLVLVQSNRVVIGIRVSSGKHYSQIHICRTTAQWMTFCYIFLLNPITEIMSYMTVCLHLGTGCPVIFSSARCWKICATDYCCWAQVSEVANSVGSLSSILCSNLRNLCAIFDQAINIYKRVKRLFRTCLFHLRKTAKLICPIAVWIRNGQTCFCFITPGRL